MFTRPGRAVPEDTIFTAGRPVLNETAAVHRLVACGALRPEQAADPGLSVVDESRRCRCLIVRLGSAGWVVKQGTTTETRESVRLEAAVYRAIHTTSLARYVPRLLDYDEDAGHLVTEYVVGESPREVHTADPARRLSVAAGIGALLARLHRSEDLGLAPKPPPPILKCGYPTLDSVEFHSPGSMEIIRRVQSNEALMLLLDTVRDRWTPEAITHNDLRGDNVLIRESGEPVFLDWEMGGPGDRRWDVSGLLAERLVWWLTDPDCWVPNSPQATSNAAAVEGMRTIREFAHAFLGGYAMTYTGALDLSRAGLTCLMSWCAARLVQFAIENTHQRNVPLATSLQLLQIAVNMHLNPDAAARTFFGLALTDA
jgi:aminoglycoside phosphotransferase (APT) family kinase protein